MTMNETKPWFQGQAKDTAKEKVKDTAIVTMESE